VITRPIKIQDIQQVADVLREFRSEEISPDYMKSGEEHTVMVERILMQHFFPHSWLVENKGEVMGILIAHVAAMPLTPSAIVIEEVVFYVKQEFRNTRAGYILFKAWTDYAKKLRNKGEVSAILMHTLADSPIDMTRHGFRELQTSYVME